MNDTTPATARRSLGRRVLAGVFAAGAVNAWLQVVLPLIGRSSDPQILTMLQFIIGAAAAATAWGAWRGARWAAWTGLAYGLVAGGMIASLGPMLDIPREGWGGLFVGGTLLLAFGVFAWWYLRRSGRGSAHPPEPPRG